MATIDKLLLHAVHAGASDIHLTSGERPMLRISGVLHPLQTTALSSEQIRGLVMEIAGQEDGRRIQNGDTFTFAYETRTGDRFRVNVYPEHRGLAAAVRHLAASPPTFADLGIPELYPGLIRGLNGIVMVVGATGAGKSSTLAACVNAVNERENAHIITLENPIEYRYTNKNSLIHQREIGRHASDFSSGIIEALRQDPDIIVVGEIRSKDEVARALLAAETGHLVLTTIHANSAPKAIDRVISTFDSGEQPMVRSILADTVQIVVAQQLVPDARGDGRRAALEILVGTPAVRSLIREGKIHQIQSTMESSRPEGHQTMDRALIELARQGAITPKVAQARAPDPEAVRKAIQIRT